MSTPDKHSWKEYVGAGFTLLLIVALFGAMIWGANSCSPKPTKTVCPYCGKSVILEIRPNGEEKKK